LGIITPGEVSLAGLAHMTHIPRAPVLILMLRRLIQREIKRTKRRRIKRKRKRRRIHRRKRSHLTRNRNLQQKNRPRKKSLGRRKRIKRVDLPRLPKQAGTLKARSLLSHRKHNSPKPKLLPSRQMTSWDCLILAQVHKLLSSSLQGSRQAALAS
jgi:hypothetical protein